MSRFSFLCCLIAVAALTAAPRAQTTDRPPAEEVARALQKKYDLVRDFSADFVHTYQGGVLRKKANERGTVIVKKPGLMRWTYTAPDKKEFVSDGVKMYSYVPADRQVIVSPAPREDEATTGVAFLAGRGNLLRDFTISYADTAGPDEYVLKLVPRQPQEEYEWLQLAADRKTLAPRRLVTSDQQGGTSTLTFTKLKENVGIPDKAFAFTIPRGVDVVNHGPRS
jgi:outer membrane lipoprotein carrier protein